MGDAKSFCHGSVCSERARERPATALVRDWLTTTLREADRP